MSSFSKKRNQDNHKRNSSIYSYSRNTVLFFIGKKAEATELTLHSKDAVAKSKNNTNIKGEGRGWCAVAQ